MQPGETIEDFVAKNGKHLLLRVPDLKDAEDYLEFVNKLVEEDAPIKLDQKQNYLSELEYTVGKISRILAGNEIAIVAVAEGKVVADASIIRKTGRERDVGTLGIAISKEFRNIGLGFELIRLLLERAKAENYRIIELEVYANNPAARHLYEKSGFKEAGTKPKVAIFKGQYVDSISMYKEL